MPGPKDRSTAETESPDCRQGFQLSESLRERFPRCDQGGSRIRNSHHPFGHSLQRLVFGIEGFECRTPLVVLHSLSLLVIDLCRRLTLAFRAGSLVTCQRLRSWFFRRISSLMPDGIGGRWSSRGRHMVVDAARAFKTTPEKFSTHVSIAITCNFGLNGI
jgi:hypothetical protein